MFDTAFDVTLLEKPLPDGRLVTQHANRLANVVHHAISSHDEQDGMAFLIGTDGHPMFICYRHWCHLGGNASGNHHGVRATFVDLSRVSSAEADDQDLVLRGEPGFVRECDTYEMGYDDPDEGNPLNGFDDAVVTRECMVRIERACDGWVPSPLSVISQYLAERDGGRNDGRDGELDDILPASSVMRCPLEPSDDPCRLAGEWRRERLIEARDEFVAGCLSQLHTVRFVMSVTVVALAWVMLAVGLAMASMRNPTGVLVAILGVMSLVLVTVTLGMSLWNRLAVEGLDDGCMIEFGSVLVIREGDIRYLLFCEDPWDMGRSAGDGMTRYTLVRLTDGNLSPAYDEGSRILEFEGDGIWQIDNMRRDIDGILIPSRDACGMSPIPSYRMADTFVPSIRTVLRVVRQEETAS